MANEARAPKNIRDPPTPVRYTIRWTLEKCSERPPDRKVKAMAAITPMSMGHRLRSPTFPEMDDA